MMNLTTTREINRGALSDSLRHQGQEVLRYEIMYPIIKAKTAAEEKINNHQRSLAHELARTIKNRYLSTAQEQYKALAAYGGFAPLEAHSAFQIMHNSSPLISLFTDTYFQLRHKGSRLTRRSLTYDMRRGTALSLTQLVGQDDLLWQTIHRQLASQIAREAELNPGSYYTDWQKHYRSSLQLGGFYLTDDGVILYYQQDTIANQNAGLPSFLIPYHVLPHGVRYVPGL